MCGCLMELRISSIGTMEMGHSRTSLLLRELQIPLEKVWALPLETLIRMAISISLWQMGMSTPMCIYFSLIFPICSYPCCTIIMGMVRLQMFPPLVDPLSRFEQWEEVQLSVTMTMTVTLILLYLTVDSNPS